MTFCFETFVEFLENPYNYPNSEHSKTQNLKKKHCRSTFNQCKPLTLFVLSKGV